MKTFLFYLGHPAHWHNVKIPCKAIQDEGHNVVLVARKKDVLFQLLEGEDLAIEMLPARKRSSKLGTAINVLGREREMLRIAKKHKPDVMIGTDIVITHIGKLLGIPSIILNEDDADAVPLFAKYGFPYCTVALAPTSTNVGSFGNKHIQYAGYHELAYLHPDHFQIDRGLVQELIQTERQHFMIRAASLTAHHDDGRTGIDDELALEIIGLLEPKGKVIISAERELCGELEPYRMSFHPKHMHHVLGSASLYVGDSQTMTAEAAVLGVPSIRFNDFVGELGYLEELEHQYGLTRGIRTSEPDALMDTIRSFIQEGFRESLKDKRDQMLSERINVAEFFKWFFLNFPDSMTECRSNEQLLINVPRWASSGSATRSST